MNSVVRATLKVSGWLLVLVAIVGGAIVFRLAHIGTPSDSTSLRFAGFVPLPKETALSVLDYLTVSDRNLFVTNESTGSVYKILLPDSGLPTSDVQRNSTPPPASAHGVALDSSRQVALVTRSEANSVDVFDPTTMKDIARIPVLDDADAILYDSEFDVFYVAHGDARAATLIDGRTHSVAATIPLGGKPEFMAKDPQTHRIYQNLNDLNVVVEVDMVTRAVSQRWPLLGCEGPAGMALDTQNRRLFIACAGNSKLAIFDLNNHKVISTVAIGGHPDTVAYDSDLQRIYSAGKAGVMSVVNQDGPDSYHLLSDLPLHYGAHTLAIDARTHYVYVGYASLLTEPRIGVFVPIPSERTSGH